MKKKQVFVILVLLLSAGISASTFNIQLPKATYLTIYIRIDGSIENDYENIIKKVTDSLYDITRNVEMTTICVQASNIEIDGLNHCLMGVCGGPKYGIQVESDSVTIKNFKIERFDEAGIYLKASSNCDISMCEIENYGPAVDAYGIWLWHSSNNNIYNNVFIDNVEGGIHLDSSSGNKINKNTIVGSDIGIDLSGSSNNNRVYKNAILGKCNVGVGSYNSSNNYIYENNITKGDDGVVLTDSKETYIYRNNVTLNNRGVVLTDSSENYIYDYNTIEGNRDGVYLERSSNNDILKNTITGARARGSNTGLTLHNSSSNEVFENKITDNRIGVWLHKSSNNIISENNITKNTECAVSLDSSTKNNIFENDEMADNPNGVRLLNSSYNNISGNNITNCSNIGVYLDSSTKNTIVNNVISGNSIQKGNVSVTLRSSLNNTISANTIVNNNYGVSLLGSLGNTISGNIIANNEILSISLDHTASNNFIYHNDFMDLARARGSVNVWNNGTLEEKEKKAGNYWSDYDGVDEDGDGIGDKPYIIDDDNQDSYPLIVPRKPIPFFWKEVKYDCTFEGNATISILHFDCDDKAISFNINLANKNGLFNIAIPRTLLDGQFNVTIDGTLVPSILCWNKIYTLVCFEASIRQFDENSPYNVRVKADVVTPLRGDVNNDGIIDIFDALLVALNFGEKS